MTAALGIHHVTAIAGVPQRNVDFYTGLLGLRLVKRTVNFDDPTTYHLYYGDELGRPGSILTFFPWMGIRRGRPGTGQVAVTSFSIAPGSLAWWRDRLASRGVAHRGPERRFDEEVLSFADPDGLQLELVAHPRAEEHAPWDAGPVPSPHAIRGLHHVAIWLDAPEPTASVLTGLLGFREARDDAGLRRYASEDGAPGTLVDVREPRDARHGLMGGGTVHHVAWRVADDAAQDAVRAKVEAAGLSPTAPIDRRYFRSVYFHEPGGVLFELATESPGFTRDEPAESLGSALKLPPWFEGDRARIESSLPPLNLDAVLAR